MSDLRPEGTVDARAVLILRSFRAVKDGHTFCWDLYLVAAEQGDEVELPAWLDAWEAPFRAAQAGHPALMVRQLLDDRVFASAVASIDDGPAHAWLTDAPAWLRWVKVYLLRRF